MFTYFSGTSLKLNHTSCAAAACCSARGKYTNSEDENAEEASEGDKGVEMYSEAAIGGSGGGGWLELVLVENSSHTPRDSILRVPLYRMSGGSD